MRNKDGLTEKEFLESYDDSKYKKPSVTVDMLIFTVRDVGRENYRRLPKKALQILMIKRGNHPYMGQWALPGGFVEIDESLDDAALRELKEEANIDNIYMEQLYTWGDVNRDPRTRVIGCSYMSLADSSLLDIKAGDDADDAAWFTLKTRVLRQQKAMTEKGYIDRQWIRLELINGNDNIDAVINITKTVEGRKISISREIVESNGIAFDHAMIVQYGIERLRNKIEYTDIAFNLMPEYFSLTQLQQVYEVILGRELLKANFRRKIGSMVLETNRHKRDAGHRPSKLYKFNPDWMERTF